MVDLPDPEGPSNATISPGITVRLTPRSTSMRTPPCSKLRVRLVSFTTGLFIAQHLHGIGARRLVGGIERGKETQHQRHDDDGSHFGRICPRGKFGEEPDLRIPQILPRNDLYSAHDRLAEEQHEESENQPGKGSDGADYETRRHEYLQQ